MDSNKLSQMLFSGFSYLSVLGAGICIVLYIVGGKIGLTIDWIGVLLLLMAWTSAFIISNAYSTTKKNDALIENVNTISREVTLLRDGTPAQIISLTTHKNFYNLLEEKATNAKKKVWLTHLDELAPTSPEFSDPSRVQYFEAMLKFIQDHDEGKQGNVKIRRIESITTDSKLAWVEKLIRDTSPQKNLQVAYINLDKFKDTTYTSVISCQIIDDDEMFLLNPLLNQVPKGDFKDCIYFENISIVAMYTEYYQKIWDEITKDNCEYGCLLKNGPGIELFLKHKDAIKNNIDNKSCHQPAEIPHGQIPVKA